ncbi:C-terminal domain of 1-Cys peroxiredoxin [Phytophthora infestans]|uniref:C-terminal domain of 1-Cys peroxiredoxin n=1 Tax=Phytophthora infestans TaxID=4787 RepID=A0A833SX18_PHYIN|nr:C-terminal domain of 1-Cys peroxiredoxin [Phytophthora infestans]KAF4144490.1 C-terminal domain of 1-Cys peroxiredoxin [Phytophthora infestans]
MARQAQVGSKLPDLVGESQVGVVRAHDYLAGGWGIICSFPQARHPTWLSELGALQKLQDQFEARNARVLALHIASLREQSLFLSDVNETQEVKVKFPVLADEDGELSRRLGLVVAGAPKHAADAGRLPFSCTIVLDLDLTVRMLTYYPMSVGRNFYEVLRALDALQLCTFEQVVTPVNWKVSDDVFVEPDVTTDAAKKLFPQGTHEIKPYVRLTASPSISNDN